jgi:putative oxidoreductase
MGISSGLLVLRVVVGFVFFMHGWQKLVDNGISATQQGFDGMGVPLPDITAVLVTFVELVGGTMLIAGFLTRIAGVLLIADMISAMFIVHVENGFFVTNGGYELVFLLAGGALALAIAGPGTYSADVMVGIPTLVRSDVVGTRLAGRR